MTRAELQQMAERKLRAAKVLLAANEPSDAYYLAGYAVECGIKACIARSIMAETIPPKGIDSVYQHDAKKLIALAGLQPAIEMATDANPEFGANWAMVRDWDVADRYSLTNAQDAADLIQAIDDPVNGVLSWIKAFW